MALEHLVGTLTREAEAEAAVIRAAAEAEAGAIRARSERACTARRTASGAAREDRRHAAVERAVAVARRVARGETLTARWRLIDRVFTAARANLGGAMERPEYRAALAREVEAALSCLGGRPATVRCHPSLSPVLEPLVRARPGVRVQPDGAVGAGFRAVSDDGSLDIDGTLEGRLASRAPRLAIEVAARIGAPA